MKKQTAFFTQKIIWHIRWVLLIGLMIFNAFCFYRAIEIESSLPANGFVFALYFLLGQLEGYFECKSSCKIKMRDKK